MSSTFNASGAAFEEKLTAMQACIDYYCGLSKDDLMSVCVNQRLDYALQLYNQETQAAASYLLNVKASAVYKEINFQQKRAYKVQRELFTSEKERNREKRAQEKYQKTQEQE